MGVIVPLIAVPSQQLKITLGDQLVSLRVYQRRYGLFIDVYVQGTLIIGGVLGLNRNLIVRSAYLGFVGDFVFVDTQGSDDPDYTSLGDRFQLVYLQPSEAISSITS